jgi:hypothetical protein
MRSVSHVFVEPVHPYLNRHHQEGVSEEEEAVLVVAKSRKGN